MEVTEWRKHILGRWCAELRWYGPGITELSGWFAYDAARLRRADGLVPVRR